MKAMRCPTTTPTMGSVDKDKLTIIDFQFSEKGEVVACP